MVRLRRRQLIPVSAATRSADSLFDHQEIPKMKKTFWFAALVALGAGAPSLAQHSSHGAAQPAAATAAEMTDGEVRRIDKARGTVLLKHGEIRNLNMGAMTMAFKLKDPAMADQLKVGDKVKFTAEQKGEDLIVTSIRK
jgi:Cu/Ag efflux protein CusF